MVVMRQATSGGGGWPMSVFLTPDLQPFLGGTYFPPQDAYGRPGSPHAAMLQKALLATPVLMPSMHACLHGWHSAHAARDAVLLARGAHCCSCI